MNFSIFIAKFSFLNIFFKIKLDASFSVVFLMENVITKFDLKTCRVMNWAGDTIHSDCAKFKYRFTTSSNAISIVRLSLNHQIADQYVKNFVQN